jgi:hypothetical protein
MVQQRSATDKHHTSADDDFRSTLFPWVRGPLARIVQCIVWRINTLSPPIPPLPSSLTHRKQEVRPAPPAVVTGMIGKQRKRGRRGSAEREAVRLCTRCGQIGNGLSRSPSFLISAPHHCRVKNVEKSHLINVLGYNRSCLRRTSDKDEIWNFLVTLLKPLSPML